MEYKNSKISESNKKKIIKVLFNDVSKKYDLMQGGKKNSGEESVLAVWLAGRAILFNVKD